MRIIGGLIAVAWSVTLAPANAASSKTLDIYFIDVEGGKSTLVITPDRHTLLIDTGWAGDGSEYRPGDPHKARDANRIVAAARDAGVSQIEHLLITHFHTDHNGERKGGARVTFEALHHVPGLEDVWQLHAAADVGDRNFPARYIANVDQRTAHSPPLRRQIR